MGRPTSSLRNPLYSLNAIREEIRRLYGVVEMLERAIPVSGAGALAIDHGSLTGLADDDHDQYLLLAGRTGQEIGDASKVESSSTVARAMANAVYTDVIFEIEDNDLLNEYDNATGIFTATYAGTYAVAWSVDSANAAWAAGGGWVAVLSRNNSTAEGDHWQGFYWQAMAIFNGSGRSGGAAIVTLAAADTLRIKVFHNQGGAVNTSGVEQQNFFHIARIA